MNDTGNNSDSTNSIDSKEDKFSKMSITPSLSSLLRDVRNFDPNNIGLFVMTCDLAFRSALDEQKPHLLRSVISKLDLDFMGKALDITNWEDLKNLILITYEDNRDFATLLSDINDVEYQEKRETIFAYTARINELYNKTRRVIFSKNFNNESNLDTFEAIIKNAFIAGINDKDIRTIIKARNPQDLKTSITIAEKEHKSEQQIKNKIETRNQNPRNNNNFNQNSRFEHNSRYHDPKADYRNQNPRNNNNFNQNSRFEHNSRYHDQKPNYPNQRPRYDNQQNENFCNYCKTTGHILKECRRRPENLNYIQTNEKHLN
jgi:hypothetical protein